MVALTFALCAAGLVGVPATAQAAGCEVVAHPRDRAECEARAQAREAARDEVRRQVEGGEPRGSATDPSRSAEWRAAMAEADGVDPSALLEPRPLAAIGGSLWFLLAVRSRRRARAVARRA